MIYDHVTTSGLWIGSRLIRKVMGDYDIMTGSQKFQLGLLKVLRQGFRFLARELH